MKKILITVDNIDDSICREDGRCYIGPDMILTPGAKDELAKRRVPIVYETRPAAQQAAPSCCRSADDGRPAFCDPGKLDEFAVLVAALIRKECGVTDPEQLRTLTRETLRRLRNRCC